MDFDSELSSCGASEPFALRVIGDEMSPEFEDGNIIVIDPGGHIKHECFVVAKLDDSYIFRQLILDKDQYTLHALKPGIEDISLHGGMNDIVGVISQKSGRRRKEHKRYDL